MAGWGMTGAAIYDASMKGPEVISLNMVRRYNYSSPIQSHSYGFIIIVLDERYDRVFLAILPLGLHRKASKLIIGVVPRVKCGGANEPDASSSRV